MDAKKQPASLASRQSGPAGGTENSLRLAILKQMVTLATSGFGLIAALSWNNVVQELVNTYIKPHLSSGSGIISLLLYAIAITTLAVTFTYQLSKLVEKLEKK